MTGKSLLRISATRLFVGVFLVLAIPGPVHAEKVGVAAAVNPDAFSSLAGAPQSQINIGKSIFYNERINTTGSGLVQVLLIDGSTFTVGPGSDLVIDRFVYDPKKGTGQITASFSKGVMRFVGGKLSKNDGGVTVNTPAGALAIRGGIAYVDFKSATNYAILFVFGEYLKMGGKTLFEPGFGWFVNNGVVETKKFSAADLKLILAALTNNNPNWGGDGNKSNPASTFKLVNTQSLQQLIADANTQKIVDQANKVEPTPPGGGGGGGSGGGGCPPDCPPPPDTRTHGSFTGYSSGFLLTNGAPKSIGNLSPDEVVLVLTAASENPEFENTVVAGLSLREIDPTNLLKLLGGFLQSTEYELGYGGEYLKDGSYEPSAHPEGSIIEHFLIFSRTTPVSVTGTLISGHSELPDGLCDGCDFLQWGHWNAQLTQAQNQHQTFNPNTQSKLLQGWFVAGDITKESDLPQDIQATYNGNAIGYASTKLEGQWSTPAVEKGKMDMSWNFATRRGELNVTEFGPSNKSFGGTMCGAGLFCFKGNNHFAGALSGAGNIKGAAAGSFVNKGDIPAAGVIGNFAVGNNNWKANGIFGGTKVANP